jgi:hypothetical protein
VCDFMNPEFWNISRGYFGRNCSESGWVEYNDSKIP